MMSTFHEFKYETTHPRLVHPRFKKLM